MYNIGGIPQSLYNNKFGNSISSEAAISWKTASSISLNNDEQEGLSSILEASPSILAVFIR